MSQRRGIDFARNHIKGKIAELIFHHMFEAADTCTIVPFGYETLSPILAQYQHLMESTDELKAIRNIPDFILISNDHKHMLWVDVKYRARPEPKRLMQIARDIQKRWGTAWIFLASPQGFFFSSCAEIIKRSGEIAPLPPSMIPADVQQEYLQLLNEFETA